MIYDVREMELFERMIERKSMEKSIYESFSYIHESDRYAVVRSIDADIQRSHAMLRIACNDFSEIDKDLGYLAPAPSLVSSEFYEHYLQGLNESEREDESAFFFCKNLGVMFFVHMMRGKESAAKIHRGEAIISEGEKEHLRCIYDNYMVCKRRCESLMGDTDFPYAEANRHIDFVLEECSLLMKMHSGKKIETEDVCRHIDNAESDSADAFNKLFLTDFDPRTRGQIVFFQDHSEDRLDLFYALLILNENLSFDSFN